MNKVRADFYKRGKEKGYNFATYISPYAFVDKNAKIGENSFVFEDNTIQYNAKIGTSVVLWSGNHIGHSAKIDDNCFISSHVVVSGYCEIGKNSFAGVNSTFGNNISVAEETLVAAGAVITKSIELPGGVYAGNPAQRRSKAAIDCL